MKETARVSRQKRGRARIAHLRRTGRTPYTSIDTLRPNNVPSLGRISGLRRRISWRVGRFIVLKDTRNLAKKSLFFLAILIGSASVLRHSITLPRRRWRRKRFFTPQPEDT